MSTKTLLMIPGPTPVPDDVLRAVAQPMINHRGPEYMALQREVLSGKRRRSVPSGHRGHRECRRNARRY